MVDGLIHLYDEVSAPDPDQRIGPLHHKSVVNWNENRKHDGFVCLACRHDQLCCCKYRIHGLMLMDLAMTCLKVSAEIAFAWLEANSDNNDNSTCSNNNDQHFVCLD